MAMQEEVVQISIMENESKNYNSNVELNGILTLNPKQEKKGIVIFAHGSGSGRDSPRNQYVASVLNNNSGIGTLLVDLLTLEEQQIDEKTREYRFNIKLLVNRLAAVTDWLLQHSGVRTQNISSISMGYFGSSTGAAAALIAAAERSDDVVKAIISRGGRPDLAGSSNAQLGKKTYVEQEIDAVIHAGKSKQKAIDVVKTQSLQNMVLRKFHNLNNRETSQRFYTISSDNRYLILDNNLFKLFFEDNDDNGNQSQFMRNEITSRWDLSMLLKISIT